MKAFVAAAVEEALKLESALARLRTPRPRGGAPLRAHRRHGGREPVEIYPFLGSSRLEEPINRYRPDAVFHGHAHRGQLEGTTSAGVPVYNVALPLLRRRFPEQPPFRVVEIPVVEEPAATARPRRTHAGLAHDPGAWRPPAARRPEARAAGGDAPLLPPSARGARARAIPFLVGGGHALERYPASAAR